MVRLSIKELEAIIENYEAQGRDTTDLRNLLDEVRPPPATPRSKPQPSKEELSLRGKRMEEDDYNEIWKDNHQAFLARIYGTQRRMGLVINPKLDLRGWIIRRCAAGERCVMPLEVACPCENPLERGCPLFRGM